MHPLVVSVIFGATKIWQLKEILEALEVGFTTHIIADINSMM